MPRNSTRADLIQFDISANNTPNWQTCLGLQGLVQEGGDTSDVDLGGIGDTAPISAPGPADASTSNFDLNYDPEDTVHQWARTKALAGTGIIKGRYVYTGTSRIEAFEGTLSGWKINHAANAPRKATFKINYTKVPTNEAAS